MKLSQLETPCLVLDLDMMEKNMDKMESLLGAGGPALRPHYKSHKSTWIAQRQIARGAKGITCAKLEEACDLAEAGIRDILIANQITDPAKMARAAALGKACRLTVCVDSAANIREWEAVCAALGATLHLYVEYDIGMDRCGARTKEQVRDLIFVIRLCPHLIWDGIQAYAGNLAHEEDTDARREGSEDVEKKLRELIGYLKGFWLEPAEISGVSTGTVSFHCRDTVYTEVQCGSYLFMDEAYEAVGAPFSHALFVLASVISLPREGLIVTDAGLKTVSVDQRPPRFERFPELPVGMSEEHVQVEVPGHDLKINDRLKLIPSHCCTTVNLHDFYVLVRGDEVVGKIPVTGRGHSR